MLDGVDTVSQIVPLFPPTYNRILLESDPTMIAQRVTKSGKDDDKFGLGAAGNIPIGDQTLTQALQMAREQLAKTLLK